MIYDLLINSFKKKLYVVSYEKFKSDTANRFIERFILKHSLLKPKIILHNEQPFGFEQTAKQHLTLEKFGIYGEIIYYIDEDDTTNYLEGFNLYAEREIDDFTNKLTKLITLGATYQKYIDLERVQTLGESFNMLVISSKLEDQLMDFVEEESDNFISTSDLITSTINIYLSKFLEFIKEVDNILYPKKKLAREKKVYKINRKTRLK